MAVTFVRSGVMAPGKFHEAEQYIRDRNAWLKETFDVEPTLMVLLGGQVGRLASATEVESVAKIEEIRRALIGGARSEELHAAREGLFLPAQTRDRIWLHVE